MSVRDIIEKTIIGKAAENKHLKELDKLIVDYKSNKEKIFALLSKLSKATRKNYIMNNKWNIDKNSFLSYIISMPFDERIEYINFMIEPYSPYNNIFDTLISDFTEEQLEIMLNKIRLQSIAMEAVIEKLSEEKRIKYIDKLDTEEKRTTLLSLSLLNREKAFQIIDSKELTQIIEECDNIKNKLDLIFSLDDEEKKMEYVLQIDDLSNYTDLIMENLSELSDDDKLILLNHSGKKEDGLKFVPDKLQYYLNIKSKDTSLPNILILSDKYTNLFSEKQMQRIICFNNIQEELLNLEADEFFVLSEIFKDKMNAVGEIRWENFLENYFKVKDDFSLLIDDIYINQDSDVDYNLLRRIMQFGNIFNIDSIDKLNDIEKIKINKCDELISSDDIDEKRLAICEKKFGIDLEYARMLVDFYCKDIINYPPSQIKNYLINVVQVVNSNDAEELNELYNSCENSEIADKEQIENTIIREFEKNFNHNFMKKDDVKQYVDENGNVIEDFYDAGVDFTMLVQAYGATHNSGYYISNYYDSSVGQGEVKSSIQQSCSMIRWDMLGNASFGNSNSVVFGYNKIEDGELLNCSNRDSSTKTNGFSFDFRNTDSIKVGFYFTDGLINHTDQLYNEVNTKRKMPDYIVAFKDENGQIINYDMIIKAREDFLQNGIKIPVMVIDMKACKNKAIEELLNDIEEYKINPSHELGNSLYLKMNRCNRELEQFVPKEIAIRAYQDYLEYEKEIKDIHYIVNISREKEEDKSKDDNLRNLESIELGEEQYKSSRVR